MQLNTRAIVISTDHGVNGRLQHRISHQGGRRRAHEERPGFKAGMEQSGSAV